MKLCQQPQGSPGYTSDVAMSIVITTGKLLQKRITASELVPSVGRLDLTSSLNLDSSEHSLLTMDH